MKIFTILLSTIFLTLSFTTSNAASDKMYSGYVVTVSNDTIHGKIQMLTPSLNEVKVKFTEEGTNKKYTFKSTDLSLYSFNVPVYKHKEKRHVDQVITYVRKSVERAPVAFGTKEPLIERPVEGSINLYNYYVEQNDNVQAPFTHVFYVEKDNSNSLVEVNRTNFKEVLRDWTRDYPELNAKIGAKGYGYKFITKIISEYNTWVADNSEEFVLGMR